VKKSSLPLKADCSASEGCRAWAFGNGTRPSHLGSVASEVTATDFRTARAGGPRIRRANTESTFPRHAGDRVESRGPTSRYWAPAIGGGGAVLCTVGAPH
jgi:hypothetical protein